MPASNSFDVSEISTVLGNYFRENKGILAEQLYHTMAKSSIIKYATIVNCTDEVGLPNLLVKEIVQPSTNPDNLNFSNGAIAFGARVLKVRRFKFDLNIQPQELEMLWLSYFKTPGSEHEQKMSLQEFVMAQVVNRVQEDIRVGLTNGVYNVSGTAPIDIVDGFTTLVNNTIAAGDIIDTTVTASNIREQVEEIYDNLGEVYKEKATVCIMPGAVYDAWLRENTGSLGREYNFDSKNPYIYGTNCRVERDALMTGTRAYILPASGFLYVGADTMAEHTNIRVQTNGRNIWMLGDGKIGIEFAYTNPLNSPIATGDIAL